MKHVTPFHNYTPLYERTSDILYHATSITGAADILTVDIFHLSAAVGKPNDTEVKKSKGKWFFLSCSREKYGGYARQSDLPVVIVLDGRILGYNHKSTNVDFWSKLRHQNMPGSTLTYTDETEERIITDSPVIKPATKYIKEVHVFLTSGKPNSQNTISANRYYARSLWEIDAACASHNIPVYFYGSGDRKGFESQNKSKAMKGVGELGIPELEDLAKIETEDTKGDHTELGGHINTLIQFTQVLKNKNWRDIPAKIQQEISSLNYAGNRHEVLDKIGDAIQRSRSSGIVRRQDKAKIAEIIQKDFVDVMHKNKLRTLDDFVDFLAAKAKSLNDEHTQWRRSFEGWITGEEKYGGSCIHSLLKKDENGKMGYEKWDAPLSDRKNVKDTIQNIENYLNGDKTYAEIMDQYSKEDWKGLLQAIKEKDVPYYQKLEDYEKDMNG